MPAGGHFRLVVSSGDLPCHHCQCAFGDGEGFPPLSFCNVQFPICGVHSHLRGCGFSPVLRGSHLTLPDLWPGIYLMAVTLHSVLAPQFIVRCNSLVPELLSGPSQIQYPHGSYSEYHSFFSFFSPSIEIVYADISSSGRSWQRGYGSISSPLSPVVAGRGGDPGVLDFALLAVQFPSGSCGLA